MFQAFHISTHHHKAGIGVPRRRLTGSFHQVEWVSFHPQNTCQCPKKLIRSLRLARQSAFNRDLLATISTRLNQAGDGVISGSETTGPNRSHSTGKVGFDVVWALVRTA